MTARDLLLVMLRRWPFILLGAALSLGAAYQATQQEVVHWTRLSVVGLPPSDPVYPNRLEKAQYNLTPLVGLTVTRYNQGQYPLAMSTSGPTIYGEGLRAGSTVRLHNSGSQWIQVHDRPLIDVQVVDTDPARVQAQAMKVFQRLRLILREEQEDLGVAPGSQVTLISSPEVPVVRAIGGSPTRAGAATALVGMILTAVLVLWGDRVHGRLRGRRTA